MKNRFNIIIAVLVIVIYIIISNYSLKKINKEDIDVSRYIKITDDISENYKQINWKYVASIIGVLEKNNFKKIKEHQIESVSNLFINKSNNELNSLESVLKELNLSKKKKDLVYKYINQLKYFGLNEERLKPNTKYTLFIDNIKEDAINNYKKYKILPSITIAQAILESGWGESILAKEYNNLFGIKADVYWKGDYVVLETTEFEDQKINDSFRKYNHQGESLNDHARFLVENKRYKNNGVFEANTYVIQAKALQDAGYSTDTNTNGERIYASKLIEIIRQYNLQLIDSEVQS